LAASFIRHVRAVNGPLAQGHRSELWQRKRKVATFKHTPK
jgi:hypothetical protein